MSKKLFNLADSLRGKIRDLEIELSRIALIVLSDREDGNQSYDRKRVRKKADDQKLNRGWGIESFCQLEDIDVKSLYEAYSELELHDIRKFFSDKLLNDRFNQFQGLTSAGFEEILERTESSTNLNFIFADCVLGHYAKINELSNTKLFFRNHGCLPLANILFESKVHISTYENIDEVSCKDGTFIHLGPFNFKPIHEKRNSSAFTHSTQENEIYELIKRNQKTAIIALLPISVSFNSQSKLFREFVNSSNRIKSVKELSSKALQFTQIQTFILEIASSKNDSKLTIKAKDKEEIKIAKDEFFSIDDWSLLRHYSTGYKLEKESILLGSIIVDSFRGPALKKADDGDDILVVQNKDLKENDILNSSDIQSEKYEYKGNLDRYYLQENDVLLVCRGYKFSSAIIKNINGRKIVASSNILVIRLDTDKASPTFVNLFLTSPLGKAELESRQVGTAQLVLSVKDIKSIALPLLPLAEQKKIESGYYQAKEAKDQAIIRANNQYQDAFKVFYSTMGILKEN